MERWDRPSTQPPSQRRGRSNPSFSSSLLDAIYRSIDESNGGSPDHAVSCASKKQNSSGDYKLAPPIRLVHDPADDRRRRRLISNSSSSDCSSFGGFSSSDADTTARIPSLAVLTRSDPILSDPLETEKKRPGSIRSRIRDLQKSSGSASPGARLAAFLNAIFSAAAGGSPKKPKIAVAACGGWNKSGFSSSSPYPRSCTSKALSSRSGIKQSSVRFGPGRNLAVDEDLRRHHGQDRVAAPAADRRRMVVEILRGFDMEEGSDCDSDSSSDLFELENLSVIGRFTDELPLYETTKMGTNLAVAHGLVL